MTNYTETTINGFQVSVFNTYHGRELYISKDGVQLYGHKVSGDPMEKAREVINRFSPVKVLTKTEKIEKGRLVLMSDHIKEVEVTYLTNLNGSRYYQARTWAGRHQYMIRFWDDNGTRRGTCNCIANRECRHLAKAGALDAELNGLDMHYEVFANYKAGQKRILEVA